MNEWCNNHTCLSMASEFATLADVFRARESGFFSSANYRHHLIDHRLKSLTLSSFRTIDVSVHSSGITDLDIDTCEFRYVLAGAANGTLYIHDLWDTRSMGRPKFTAEVVAHVGKSHRHAHKFSIECVQWYPQDHGLFLTSGMDKCLKVWDTNVLTPADQFHFVGKIHSHHISHIGGHHLIAVATNVNHVHLVDIKSGANTHELRGHQGQVLSCQWSNRDCNLLATGSSDKKIYFWDVRNARNRLQCLDYNNIRGKASAKSAVPEGISHDGSVNGLKFSDNGLNLISFGRDGRVRVWDVSNGRNLKCKFPRFLNKTKSYVKFDVCGDIMAIPSQSFIYTLNMRDNSVVQELSGHYMNVNTCVFRQDCQELLTGGDDRNVLIWDPNEGTNQAYQEHLQAQKATGNNLLKVSTVDQSLPSTLDTWSDDDGDDSD